MKIGRLISLVKEHPIIYDSLHPQNKDRKEKDHVWKEISTAMNIHSDIAKGRWKSLKDCYTKYLKSTMATGPASYVKYINWQWAEHMEFMKPHIKYGLILTNFELRDNQEDDLGNPSNADMQGYQSSSEVLETHDRSETPEESEVHEKSGNHERSETDQRPHRTIKRRRHASMISPTLDISRNNNSIIKYLEHKKTDDYSANELIFLGYAKSIKSFSIRRQAQVKMKIAKLMMHEEIAHSEETHRGY